ncbi:MAG TPA: ABC transporter ATP-binding protein [Solirubrobacteraceae bacterium]|nr:ABC transporter ATP-binding protein [Solirubrobacteraceae bacterium]
MNEASSGLALDGLSTKVGSFRLSPVDLTVDAGHVLVVLGPSGAGKTTLLDAIAGFRSPTAGRVHLAGRDLTRTAPEERRIGIVFQHAALFPHLSVRENVRFGLRARGDRRQQRVDELLARFGVTDHADRRPTSLSGGERQRVALARALCSDPQLLLLDEPLSALDQPTREELRGVLQGLLSDLGIPAVHVTHDRDEALTLAEHIAVIVRGELRQIQAATEIASTPIDADVARLLGWSELGRATIQTGTIVLGDLRVPTLERSGTAAVFYRPESVVLGPAQPNGAPSPRITRTIDRILPTVPLARVLLAGDPPLTALVLHRDLAQPDIRAGEPVEVQLPANGFKTFVEISRHTADSSTDND